jgi:hypothetical protein
MYYLHSIVYQIKIHQEEHLHPLLIIAESARKGYWTWRKQSLPI